MTSLSIALRDGRRFGFAEWGHPDGKPVLLFVGGSSRLVRPLLELPDIRLITVDRPGLGLSDFHPGRTLLDVPGDILQLIDALDVGRIAVVGISQGGPSALACAYRIPDRLVAVGAVSSLAPLPVDELRRERPGAVATFARLAVAFPLALRIQAWLASWMVRWSPQWTFQQVLRSLPLRDRALLAKPELAAMFIDDLVETYRQGSRGSAQEGLLAYRPWGFGVRDIRTQVYVWHGQDDESVPVAMGRYLAKAIPGCQATFLANEGHFVGLQYWREIAAQLFGQ